VILKVDKSNVQKAGRPFGQYKLRFDSIKGNRNNKKQIDRNICVYLMNCFTSSTCKPNRNSISNRHIFVDKITDLMSFIQNSGLSKIFILN
jgi:hypothetical protein